MVIGSNAEAEILTLQVSIELPPEYVVMAIESAGWLVGGDIKFKIEKEIVLPGFKTLLTTLLAVTIANAVDPEHEIPELTF